MQDLEANNLDLDNSSALANGLISSKWYPSCFLSLLICKVRCSLYLSHKVECSGLIYVKRLRQQRVISMSFLLLGIEERKKHKRLPLWNLKSRRKQTNIFLKIIEIDKTWCGSSCCHTFEVYWVMFTSHEMP